MECQSPIGAQFGREEEDHVLAGGLHCSSGKRCSFCTLFLGCTWHFALIFFSQGGGEAARAWRQHQRLMRLELVGEEKAT